jgi:hypothetical protein
MIEKGPKIAPRKSHLFLMGSKMDKNEKGNILFEECSLVVTVNCEIIILNEFHVCCSELATQGEEA